MNFLDTELFLNNYQGIRLISDLNYSTSMPIQSIPVAGMGIAQSERIGVNSSSLSYSQYSFFNDPFLTMARAEAAQNMTASFRYGSNYMQLTRGRISSYKLNVEYGSFPTSDISIDFYGENFGEKHAPDGGFINYPAPKIITPYTIQLSLSGLGDNYINSFEYSISNEYTPLYGTNTFVSSDSYIYRNIRKEDISINLNVIEYIGKIMLDYVNINPNISFDMIYKDKHGDTVFAINLINMKFVSENWSVSPLGQLTLQLNFSKETS